jgi:hypothetical protein
MRKSILLNVSSSKTIARFGAKFGVTKVCFFVVICYRLLICAFTDQCWFISTMMVRFKSVYCMWSLLLNDDTRFSYYLLCALYVRCVGHMTHANFMRSGYHFMMITLGHTNYIQAIASQNVSEFRRSACSFSDESAFWWMNLDRILLFRV